MGRDRCLQKVARVPFRAALPVGQETPQAAGLLKAPHPLCSGGSCWGFGEPEPGSARAPGDPPGRRVCPLLAHKAGLRVNGWLGVQVPPGMWLDRDSDSQEPAACSFKVLLGLFSPGLHDNTRRQHLEPPGRSQSGEVTAGGGHGPGRSRPGEVTVRGGHSPERSRSGEVTVRGGHGPGRSHSWGCARPARGSVWLQPHAQPRCPALCEDGPCGVSHLVLVTRGETCGTCPVTRQELAELGLSLGCGARSPCCPVCGGVGPTASPWSQPPSWTSSSPRVRKGCLATVCPRGRLSSGSGGQIYQ